MGWGEGWAEREKERGLDVSGPEINNRGLKAF